MQVRSRNQKFDKIFRIFLEKVLTEMKTQIRKYTKLGQICSHLQTPWQFLKTARVSVFKQGWVVQFEAIVIQQLFHLQRGYHDRCDVSDSKLSFPLKIKYYITSESLKFGK
ncbi:Hypothetical_protein [Hexamita inflata]|uniref:Hypothetical_protein n=1 Tax=Hexamita inflata TaxID=28002 RepID=A0AA86UCK0_9EUKA|nr:Hypothetical protein HINF_LOCUS40290 [Hexamita inflata]